MKNLPEELIEFLKADPPRLFEFKDGEIDRVLFRTVDELSIGMFDVDGYDFFLNGDLAEDPGERIEIEGVSLLKEGGGYDSEGILVWFTALKVFGSWDCDHHQIMVFENVDWSQIEKSLFHYLNAQWYPHSIPHRKLNPWSEAGK